MRRAAKVDANQPEIVSALRGVGCTVQPLHMVGKGCPDLMVGLHRRTYLIEVKDENAPRRDQQLRDSQVEWRDSWRGGPVWVVKSVKEALQWVKDRAS